MGRDERDERDERDKRDERDSLGNRDGFSLVGFIAIIGIML